MCQRVTGGSACEEPRVRQPEWAGRASDHDEVLTSRGKEGGALDCSIALRKSRPGPWGVPEQRPLIRGTSTGQEEPSLEPHWAQSGAGSSLENVWPPVHTAVDPASGSCQLTTLLEVSFSQREI